MRESAGGAVDVAGAVRHGDHPGQQKQLQTAGGLRAHRRHHHRGREHAHRYTSSPINYFLFQSNNVK